MMEFKNIEIEAIPIIKQYIDKIISATCDYTIGGIYMWRDFFKMQYAIEDDSLFLRLQDSVGNEYYNIPLSENVQGALDYLTNELRKTKDLISFCTVPEAYLSLLEKNYCVKSITPQPEYFDYLYTTEDFVGLPGKKYSRQRNLIHQFTRLSEDWSFQQIMPEDISEVRKFFLTECLTKDTNPIAQEEQKMVLEVLDNFEIYAMIGGLLKVDDNIVGFSLGEIYDDTLFVHIEKADRNYKGVYQMLAHQFALHFANGKVTYINREEDMGDLGLRKAKESYHPVKMLKKFTVEVY